MLFRLAMLLNAATAFVVNPTSLPSVNTVLSAANPAAAYIESLSSQSPEASYTPAVESSEVSGGSIASVSGGASDAISTLVASQSASIDTIASAIPDLAPKPDFTWTPDMGISVQGCTATLDARDAPGPSNIAWLSSLCVESKVSSLVIYNGPLTDVPHLVSKCIAVDDDSSILFTLDFRPRAYGAYEMRRPDGSYPGPEELGRKSFEYSGARNEFDTKFGDEEVQNFLESSLSSLEGATPYDPNPSEEDMLTRGPLYTCLKVPSTDANIQTIVTIREAVVNFWLSWVQDPQNEHRPGAPVNTQYVYDTKFKINAYGALLGEYSDLFGAEEGQQLTIGEAGPLDEAYVGGGS